MADDEFLSDDDYVAPPMKIVSTHEVCPVGTMARIAELEAALDDRRSPAAAAWKYLDDGVTLMRAALAAIPERYRDGGPNQLHDEIKEWLERPARAPHQALALTQSVVAEMTAGAAQDRGGEHE
jgi:hypothetical protein